ncbi:hypothetical protein [Rufibacter hautae]|uniref:Uncharacterized protein n=1 Tax=Rufibacter hautae TaxID=2595005 RepID=A0A5B6TC12_9BACT|nr:hypothetical protein [Rufibacter hautae]KAA3436564.1 hypothetical protein FOA19_19445 [Rufibacter hautae]
MDPRNPSTLKAEKIQLKKDYAFCMCLHYTLGKETADKLWAEDISRGVLIDIADLYEENSHLDSIALEASERIVPSTYSDHENKKAVVFRCLQFYQSRELDRFVKSMK